MENSPNDLQDIEELKREIDSLREENSKTKRNLMWKVRKLEKDMILILFPNVSFHFLLRSYLFLIF